MICISYRQDDAAATAQWLHDRLVNGFGYECCLINEVRDSGGRAYPASRAEMIAESDGVAVVIGRRWFMRYDEHGQPGIHHRDDFIRKDIANAITRDVPILVVLADGAEMPKADQLPPELLLLAYQPATVLRQEFRDSDAEKLVAELRWLAPAQNM
jgi:hypothetical protein